MEFEILLIMEVIASLVAVVLLRKIVLLKQRIEGIVEAVEGYIAFVTKEEEETCWKRQAMGNYVEPKSSVKKDEEKSIEISEDSQTKIIQSVLGEFFP